MEKLQRRISNATSETRMVHGFLFIPFYLIDLEIKTKKATRIHRARYRYSLL
jgi:hypothetical protein